MSDKDTGGPLAGVSEDEWRIMERLLRMPPEPHRDSPRPSGTRAEAQRRRRQRERERHPSEALRGA